MELAEWANIAFWAGAAIDTVSTVEALRRGAKEMGFVRFILDKTPFSTEAELVLFKAAVWIGFLYLEAPPWFFFVAGGMQAVAGVGNYFGWWAKIVARVKK